MENYDTSGGAAVRGDLRAGKDVTGRDSERQSSSIYVDKEEGDWRRLGDAINSIQVDIKLISREVTQLTALTQNLIAFQRDVDREIRDIYETRDAVIRQIYMWLIVGFVVTVIAFATFAMVGDRLYSDLSQRVNALESRIEYQRSFPTSIP